jgi:hypothetical protein
LSKIGRIYSLTPQDNNAIFLYKKQCFMFICFLQFSWPAFFGRSNRFLRCAGCTSDYLLCCSSQLLRRTFFVRCFFCSRLVAVVFLAAVPAGVDFLVIVVAAALLAGAFFAVAFFSAVLFTVAFLAGAEFPADLAAVFGTVLGAVVLAAAFAAVFFTAAFGAAFFAAVAFVAVAFPADPLTPAFFVVPVLGLVDFFSAAFFIVFLFVVAIEHTSLGSCFPLWFFGLTYP